MLELADLSFRFAHTRGENLLPEQRIVAVHRVPIDPANLHRLRRAQTVVMTSPEMPLIYQGDDISSNTDQDVDMPLARTAKVREEVMSREEVCRAIGIPPTATTTLKRRQDSLMLPVGNHICGQQKVTWWKSDIDTLLGMMRQNTPKQEIQAAVAEMNARNHGGKQG